MRIIVISPHPDDETLGAGGTLLKMKKRGNEIYWLNITDMNSKDGWDERIVKHRQEQIKMIRDYYKFDGFFNLNLPTSMLASIDTQTIIGKIKAVFDKVEPEWVIIPGPYDAHSDHRIVYNCCMAVSKSFRAPYIRRITTMEIVSETDYGFQKEKFEPTLFIDISEEIEDKINAMRIYDTEIEPSPFPRSLDNIRAIANYRGGSSMYKYAEAFGIIKQLE